METYKITVARPGAELTQDVKVSTDFAAVRHGQRIAGDGDTLKVFRRGECIFKSESLGRESFV